MSLSLSQVKNSLELFEIKPGTQVRVEVLKDLLPDASTALFFGKIYKLDYRQLSTLMLRLFNTSVIQALLNEGDTHSSELQDYIVDVVPPAELQQSGIYAAQFTSPVTHEFLPELFAQLEVDVADSISKLVDALGGALETVQGKYGVMLFKTLLGLNKQRAGVLGQHKAVIHHQQVAKNLVVFDVSGSVSRPTAEKIIDEVVALAYKANASLAIVSNTTSYWEPGTFTSEIIMKKAEFGGTQYETLADVFQENWATVITIADYDSSDSARRHLANCKGRIQQVLDISLVNQPSFLSVCLGQLADKVRPLLVGNSQNVIGGRQYY